MVSNWTVLKSSLKVEVYSLCPKRHVILENLGQIIKEVKLPRCPYLFAILGANWLLHAYMHMHTCQIKQNGILFGTNFET
jgi:hypothetical protein